MMYDTGGGGVDEAGDDLGQVVGRPNGNHARHRLRRRPVDGPDPGVRERRPAEGEVKQVFELDVPRVATCPGDEPFVLDPARAPADVGRHGNYNNSSPGSPFRKPG